MMANADLILVVDDDPDSRLLAHDVLTHGGYRVLEADCAETALPLAYRERPALILLDLRLPGMDGFAALAALRHDARTRMIPVIAVTASSMSSDRVRIEQAGFDDYHPKPVDIAKLVALVEATLIRIAGAATR